MAPDAERVCNPLLQKRVPVLWLPISHQFFPDLVAVETAGSFRLGGLVHPDHGGIFTVADVAFEGVGPAETDKQGTEKSRLKDGASFHPVVPPLVLSSELYVFFHETGLTQIKKSLSKIDNLC
jgi:hypothetical protein